MNLEKRKGDAPNFIPGNPNENEEAQQQYLLLIKEWLKNEPHLPDEFDDQRLLTFLRYSKFSLQRCKQKLDMYFTVRGALPELFTGRDIHIAEMQKTIDMINMFILPDMTSEGSRLSIFKSRDVKEVSLDFDNLVKYLYMMADVILADGKALNDIYIIDVAATNSKYIMKLTPIFLKKILICLLFIHSDITSLLKQVPVELLPNEYGGQAGYVKDIHDSWVEKIREHTNWFKEQENVKADEALRQNKSIAYEEIFGVHGSFRQLK